MSYPCLATNTHDRTITISGTSEPGTGTRYEVICSLMDDSDGYPRVAIVAPGWRSGIVLPLQTAREVDPSYLEEKVHRCTERDAKHLARLIRYVCAMFSIPKE